MRIVYLHQYFNTPEDSGSTRSYEFAKRLATRGHEVHVVTSRQRPGVLRGWSESAVDGVQVHRHATAYDNSMGVSARIRAFLGFAFAAARLSRRLRGDVIFATSTPLTIFLPAWWASLWRKTPIIFEVRDSWPTVPIALGYLNNRLAQRLARSLERFAYNRSVHIVALSPGMAEDATQHGAEPSRVTVIPNASDIDRFSVEPALGSEWRTANGIALDAPLVVYTGTFGAANDVGYLVDLAAEVRRIDPAVVFALVGTGAQEQALRDHAVSRDVLGTTLHMFPPIPKKEMPAILSAATMSTSVVIDNPAMNANSANKFFDALAAGRAIAINHEGWQADLIRSHRIGFILGRHDLPTVARDLVAYLRDPNALEGARERALRLARTDFDRDRLSAELIRIIEASIASPHGAD